MTGTSFSNCGSAATSNRDLLESLRPARSFIDGEFRAASTGKTFEHVDPTTERVVATVASASIDDLNDAVAAARRAYEAGWGSIVAPGQHIGMIHKMWADQGRDMPFALALGVEPAIPFLCGMPIPAHLDEAGVLGAYFGEAIQVVRCETNDLMVPATAEIVIEGALSREDKAPEGPMGEYAGYNWVGVTTQKPVYHVHAMTFRHDPILPVVVAGEPVEEDHTAWGIPNAAEALVLLRGAGLPVTFCWLPLHAANHWLVVTLPRDWRDRMPDLATTAAMCRRIGEVLYGAHDGSGVVKTIVMEDDVDPTDDRELIWAYATRAHPGTSEHVFGRQPTGALAVYLSDGEKRTMTSTKAVYDCLTRDEWTGGRTPRRTSLLRGYPAEVSQKILAGWRDVYGYP